VPTLQVTCRQVEIPTLQGEIKCPVSLGIIKKQRGRVWCLGQLSVYTVMALDKIRGDLKGNSH
jgi:hypothetical protein